MNAAIMSAEASDMPALGLPRDYNATTDFIDRHLPEGRGDKVAVVDDSGAYSYAQVAERVARAGNMLRALGLRQEARVGLVMQDSVSVAAVFWGAIKAGIVPIPINTLLDPESYRYIVRDSRVQALIVSDTLLDRVEPAVSDQPFLEHIIIDGDAIAGRPALSQLLAEASAELDAADTTADDVAFWLYSSGSTGSPKGVRHLHRHLRGTSDTYALQVLGIREDDTIFSAAKLFFAYGLGNGMTFPFAVGATAVYMAERPTPDAVMRVLREHQPTIYCGVPTLYASILADERYSRENGSQRLRVSISAGEALPEDVGNRWEQRFGTEILDGVGSTEMLHIFLSNRPGEVHYGTSGVPVPGYQARLIDEEGQEPAVGEVGELLVFGATAAEGYWNKRDKSLDTFIGPWTRTGDKYYRDEQGYYHYCGRADDMMKVGGNWVSPFEVESALMMHPEVVEAAVVAHRDAAGLIKPKAYVVLRADDASGASLVEELQGFVKHRCAPWKYPRWIAFVDELPKTATGKIQRFRLRELECNDEQGG